MTYEDDRDRRVRRGRPAYSSGSDRTGRSSAGTAGGGESARTTRLPSAHGTDSSGVRAGGQQSARTRSDAQRQRQQPARTRANGGAPASRGSYSRSSAPHDSRARSATPERAAQRRSAAPSRSAHPAQRGAAPYSQPARSSERPHGTQRPAAGQRQAVPGGTRRPPATQTPSRQRAGSLPRQPQAAYLGTPQRAGRSRLPIVVVAAAVVLLAIVLHFVFDPPNFQVTVNGREVTVGRGSTVQTLVDEGYASPTAGNLLAIDESVITEGGGDLLSATVNGEATADPATPLAKGAEVEIKDGADVTEGYTEEEKVLEHGTASSSTERDSYWFGSLHVYSEGKDGKQLVKTGDVSGVKVKKVIEPAVDAGYNVYTASTGNDKVVALTFDDGPWPDSTKAIIDIFEENNAKATFFTIGQQVANYADQIKRAKELGFDVCTHTWDHADGSGQGVNLTYMSKKEQVSEVKKGYAAIKDATGEEPPHIMRAPGGNYYGDLISTLEPYVDAEIGWDVDTEDWRQPGADTIYQRIMSVQPGQVILMHDGGGDRSQTVAAVKKAVPELIAQGYQLVTVSDLLAYPAPSNG